MTKSINTNMTQTETHQSTQQKRQFYRAKSIQFPTHNHEKYYQFKGAGLHKAGTTRQSSPTSHRSCNWQCQPTLTGRTQTSYYQQMKTGPCHNQPQHQSTLFIYPKPINTPTRNSQNHRYPNNLGLNYETLK
uniref:Uncharacterized protein n=1 Tax=Rhizophora mucronata TaxID=61149 RepID=A0A2P2NK95_RHIMU